MPVNTFIHAHDDDERRMSFGKLDFWRYHGISPELAMIWACRADLEVADLYEQKNAVDNANSGEYTNTIGLKDEYKGTAMDNDELYNHFIAEGVDSPIAAQAADMISAKSDELWLGDSEAMRVLANDFVELYAIEGDESLETLKAKLV